MIHIVGTCPHKLFGLSPPERIERQAARCEPLLVADASAVLDDSAVQWLLDNPRTILSSDTGYHLAVAVEDAGKEEAIRALRGESVSFPITTPAELGPQFIRKLRRRSNLLALSLEEIAPRRAEHLLFASVYKGVTDLVTKWVWPAPAFYATKAAARLGLSPNFVTAIGLLLTGVAAWLFYTGAIGIGLAVAWAMTFLDTVDGKLARVTVTSSRVGNWLDHGNDIVHPPLWWLCLAQGLAGDDPGSRTYIWVACAIILATYVIGRVVEISFHRLFGFNGFLFARFDALFRLVVARRNVILLMMTVGVLVDQATAAFFACALWAIVSSFIQAVRLAQALRASRDTVLKPILA